MDYQADPPDGRYQTVAHGDSGNITTSTTSEYSTAPRVKVYKRRWYVLLLFSSIGLWQGVIWNTWGPISHSAQLVFGWSDADIAMFANIGNILYCIVVFFASYIMDVLGLRIATVLCSGMIFVASGVRCITSNSNYLYWLANLGAVLNGAGGTVTFAAPALFSSVWFPAHQRAVATAIITMFNYVGVSGSLLIGPQIVHYIHPQNISLFDSIQSFPSNSSHNHTADVINRQKDAIMELMYIEGAVSAVLFFLTLAYFPSKPPQPPSMSASTERLDFKEGLKKLTKHWPFWQVGLSYSIPTGVLGMWCSVLYINLSPVGITQNEAGWLGFYYITAGAVTGLFVCMFSDHFSRHIKSLLIGLYVCACGALLWVLLLCEFYIPFTKAQLYASAILAGIFINASIPLFYEMASELCYPVAEGIIGGYLTFLNNLVGVILLSSFYIPNIGKSWLNWTMMISTAAVIPLLALIKESYGRLRMDSISAQPPMSINEDPDETSGLLRNEYQPIA